METRHGTVAANTRNSNCEVLGGNIKLWSCISWNGVGSIVKIDGNMKKELYGEILKDDLSASLDDLGLNVEDAIFQHDNDPKHTAKVVTEWLSTQSFEVLTWPAQSPGY